MGQVLEGPSAMLFAEGDPVEATKILMAFVKELRKDLPSVKGGLLGKSVLSARRCEHARHAAAEE